MSLTNITDISDDKPNIKDYVFLNLIILYYPIISIIAEVASNYPILSEEFIKFYTLEILAIGVYAILWQKAIKRFPLSLAYSNKALVIVYNLFWASVLFKEQITLSNIIGSIVILLGIWVVVKDDK